jgi:hypothetical protein
MGRAISTPDFSALPFSVDLSTFSFVHDGLDQPIPVSFSTDLSAGMTMGFSSDPFSLRTTPLFVLRSGEPEVHSGFFHASFSCFSSLSV